MQEPLIESFFSNKHNGSHKDIKVQIIDYCDPNNPERREDFWIYHLEAIYLRWLSTRKLVLWLWLLFDDLCFMILILGGVYMRPEMKSTWNNISIHHKRNSVYITFHCGRSETNFVSVVARDKPPLKGTLMQIWKSAIVFALIWK